MIYSFLGQHTYWGCKLWRFFSYTTQSFSLWMLVWLNLERILVLKFPFLVRFFLTRKKAWAIVCILILLCFLNSLPIFWIFQVVETSFGTTCYGEPKSSLEALFSLTVFIFGSFVPLFALIILNAILIHALLSLSSGGSIRRNTTITANKEFMVNLCLISVMNIIAFMPYSVIFSFIMISSRILSVYVRSVLLILARLALLIAQVRHFLNFYIYLLGIVVFRLELARLFLRRANKDTNRKK